MNKHKPCCDNYIFNIWNLQIFSNQGEKGNFKNTIQCLWITSSCNRVCYLIGTVSLLVCYFWQRPGFFTIFCANIFDWKILRLPINVLLLFVLSGRCSDTTLHGNKPKHKILVYFVFKFLFYEQIWQNFDWIIYNFFTPFNLYLFTSFLFEMYNFFWINHLSSMHTA